MVLVLLVSYLGGGLFFYTLVVMIFVPPSNFVAWAFGFFYALLTSFKPLPPTLMLFLHHLLTIYTLYMTFLHHCYVICQALISIQFYYQISLIWSRYGLQFHPNC